MTDPAIARLLPLPAAEALTDAELVALYDRPNGSPWVRVNFVSSVDGAATVDGLSGGLGGDADHRVFGLLRRLCDVVLVGAGTIRAEGYGPMRVDEPSQAARAAAGLTPHPVFAIVSARLDLDPRSPLFQDAPERPIVLTSAAAPPDRRSALAAFADLIAADAVDELCLTISPVLVAGASSRIAAGASPTVPAQLSLAHVLSSE